MNCQEEALNYARHESLSKWFQEQVNLTPNKLALFDEKTLYTFQELDKITTLLAKYLIVKYGVKRNSSIVPIYMEVSVEYVIAYIAIIKSGGAYLIVYPQTTTDFVKEMCHRVDPVCIMASPFCYPKLKGVNVSSFVLDTNWTNRILNSDCNLKIESPNCELDDVSYIAYTSGTTGKPKGIVCTQRAPIYSYNYVHALLPFEENEVYGCNIFLSWEVMRPLLKGYPAFIINEATISDNNLLAQCVKRNLITRMMITPSRLEQMLMDPNFNPDDYMSIKYFMLCGEVVTVTLAKRLTLAFPWIKMYNLYSIAETHDVALCNLNEFLKNDEGLESVYCPVGKPSPGITVHILDDQKQPVSLGNPGDVYIEGPTLAIEYLKDPEQTKEAFLTNPNGKTVYKTGDRGRFSPENNLEIWGRCNLMTRIKNQDVNLRGIEILLLKHPSVNACALGVTGELSNRKITAYIVPSSEVTEKNLEDYIVSKNLNLMIPNQFKFLKRIPVNISSKFDLKSLLKQETV